MEKEYLVSNWDEAMVCPSNNNSDTIWNKDASSIMNEEAKVEEVDLHDDSNATFTDRSQHNNCQHSQQEEQ